MSEEERCAVISLRCTAQGATRRGLHASRLYLNSHHCKPPSLLTVHAIKRVVCKFTISKAVRPGLGLSSSAVLRSQIFSHRPGDDRFARNSVFLHGQVVDVQLECPSPALPGPGTKIHVRQWHYSNQRIRAGTAPLLGSDSSSDVASDFTICRAPDVT